LDFETAWVQPTGPDIAQAIRADHADCGIATRAIATAANLDFVPVALDRFDLLMRQRDSDRPPYSSCWGGCGNPCSRPAPGSWGASTSPWLAPRWADEA
jgi:hypothetical protein